MHFPWIVLICLTIGSSKILAAEETEESVNTEPTPPEADAASDQSKSQCQLETFPTQNNFDLKEYMGKWYAISDIGFFPYQHTFDRFFNLVQDFKGSYELTEEGKFSVSTAGRTLLWCRTWEGLGEQANKEDPAKLQVSFPNNWFSSFKNPQPYWIVSTDYNYALVYNCRKELEDGTCDPSSTFAWTLNRNKNGHTDEQQKIIDEKIKQLCLKPEDFKLMPRDKECPEIEIKSEL